MSKGGDTTTTDTTSSFPDYVDPYVQDYLAQAQDATNNDYQTYGGQRITDSSADTTAAQDAIRAQATAGDPAALTTAVDTATGVANYTPTNVTSTDVTTSGANTADISSYMDPYIQNVVNVQTEAANQNYAEQQAGRDSSAVAAGAFGGDRRFVQDSLAQRDLNDQLNAITATGYSDAYNQATSLYETDAARALAASEFNSTGNLTAQTANQSAAQQAQALNLDASGQLGTLAQEQTDIGYQNAQALSAVGAQEDQKSQAALDLAYQDYLDQQNWDASQTQLYGQLLGVVTGTSGQDTTTTTTGQGTDWLSALVGLTTTLAGAAA